MTDSPQKHAYQHAYQYCLQLLARREYSQRELRQKLRQQAIEHDTIDACLTQLVEANYQSDRRFAEMLCHKRISRRYGSQKIRYELEQKGIDDSLIHSILAEHEQVWLENAIYLITRKVPRRDIQKISGDYAAKSKIIRFLLGKGYAYDTINLAFECLQADE